MRLHRWSGVLVVTMMPLAAAFADDSVTGVGMKFDAALTGAQEVPGVESSALATARVNFDRGFTRARVRVNLNGDVTVVAAHFHCQRPGANGPVAFGILNPGPLSEIAERARVTLTNADFTGADCVPAVGRPVNNIAALALAMRDGLIYLNLHSPGQPAGELRGQMVDSASP